MPKVWSTIKPEEVGQLDRIATNNTRSRANEIAVAISNHIKAWRESLKAKPKK